MIYQHTIRYIFITLVKTLTNPADWYVITAMSDGLQKTRERIIDTAEHLFFQQGFSGTSLNDVMNSTELSKGAFFHHFKNKEELANVVLSRWADTDDELVREFSSRALKLADDPLQEATIFIKLFEEWLTDLEVPLAGCLFASFTYESARFDPSMQAYIKQRLGIWMGLFEVVFERLVAARKPRVDDITAHDLTEMMAAIFEGGLLLMRALDDRMYLVRQLRLFRQQLVLLFDDGE